MKTTRKTFLGGIAAATSLGWRGFALGANVSGAPARPARKQHGYADTTWWDPYVENITDTDTYLRRKFRQDVTDKATGIGTQAIKKRLAEIVAAGKAPGEPRRITKAKCFAAQALEMSKNLSPTMGVDTEGATALVNTLAASDVTKLPGDYPLDITSAGTTSARPSRTPISVVPRTS